MNKKGQTIFGVVFIAGVFLLIWFMFLGGWLQSWSLVASEQVNHSGIEGFLLDNFATIIFMSSLVAILYYGMKVGI